MKSVEDEERGRDSTPTKWYYIRAGGEGRGGGLLVLLLGLVEYYDGNIGYGYIVREAGGGTLNGRSDGRGLLQQRYK